MFKTKYEKIEVLEKEIKRLKDLPDTSYKLMYFKILLLLSLLYVWIKHG